MKQTQRQTQPHATATAKTTTGGTAGPPQTKPKVRARRGQATDPHSIAERVRSFSSCFFFTPDYSCSVTKITVGSKLIIYVWA